jgi:CMP-N-acetylneuraminic acid synthetase
MKIVSFTPIKLNNQRLPGKNIAPLGPEKKPLCSYLFNTLRNVDGLDGRYVFCSDDAFRPYVPEWMTFLKRDKSLDLPTVRGLQIIEAFLNMVEADVYMICHVTAPFIRAETISKAIAAMRTGKYDSAFTAEFVQDYMWYDGKPVNYDPSDIVTTQNLKPVCIEKGEVFIFTRELFKTHRRRIGFKPYIQEVSEFEAVDIDTPEDYEFAQSVASHFAQQPEARK